jgi:hypothetical protein
MTCVRNLANHTYNEMLDTIDCRNWTVNHLDKALLQFYANSAYWLPFHAYLDLNEFAEVRIAFETNTPRFLRAKLAVLHRKTTELLSKSPLLFLRLFPLHLSIFLLCLERHNQPALSYITLA